MQVSDSGKSVWKTLFPAAKIPQPPTLFCNHKQPCHLFSGCKRRQNTEWENIKRCFGIVAIKSPIFGLKCRPASWCINTVDSVRAKWGTLKITGWALTNDYPPLLLQRETVELRAAGRLPMSLSQSNKYLKGQKCEPQGSRGVCPEALLCL